MREHESLSFGIAAKHVEMVEGLTGTGKTHALISRARELIEAGTDPATMLIVGQSPLHCAVLGQRLRKAMPVAGPFNIATCGEIEAAVLDSEIGYQSAGRHHRVVSGVDVAILDQDLETTGVPLDVIDRCKRAIIEGWASGLPCDDRGDEDLRTIREELLLCLEDIDSMLEEEAHYLAAGIALNGIAEHALPYDKIDHILVDDFHRLCRASQIFITRLASDSVFLSADCCPRVVTKQGAASRTGLDEISRLLSIPVRRLKESYRSQAVVRIADDIVGRQRQTHLPEVLPSAQAAEGSIRIQPYDSPTEEVLGIVRAVRDYIHAGVSPASVVISAPNGIWLSNLEAALSRCGIPYVCASSQNGLGNDDPVDDDDLLGQLASNPSDGLLWRRWCAQGDALANSSFFRMHRHAKDRLPLSETLLRICEVDRVEAMTALERKHFDAVSKLARKIEGELVSHGAPHGSREESQADASVASDPSHDDLPVDSVIIGLPGSFDGLNPELVILIGAAKGSLLPKDYFDLAQMEEPEREQCRCAARMMLYDSICKSMDCAIVSYSTSVELSAAQALGLKADKIELHDGRRMARLSLDEAVRDCEANRPTPPQA